MRHLARFASIFVLLLAGPALATAAEKENGKLKSPVDERGLERLQRETGARVRFSRATGAARFVSIDPGAGRDLMAAGGPAGVPGGKPSIGSAAKMPASPPAPLISAFSHSKSSRAPGLSGRT